MTHEITISGRNLLRQYNELRALGYETVWRGNGCIRMRWTGKVVKNDAIEETR